MTVINVISDDGKPETYSGVKISFGFGKEKEEKVFDTGDFIKDWFNLMKFLSENEEFYPIYNSSSVDHFFSDCKKFESAYLVQPVEGDPSLFHVDRTNPKLYLDERLNGLEFFVSEGTKPTWQELKEYCE